VLEIFGLSSSTLDRRIQVGLLPPPISLGERAKGWPENEIAEVVAAMIAGVPSEAIRVLVGDLVEKRFYTPSQTENEQL